MKPSEVFSQHREAIRRIVLQSGMTNPRLFGSVLHGDDLDILVDAPPGTSLFAIIELQLAMEDRLGIGVDLLTPEDLPPKFRHRVLAEAIHV